MRLPLTHAPLVHKTIALLCAAALLGCGAFASLAEDKVLMVLSPNYARQGDTIKLDVAFPDLDGALLRASRVAALDFGPLVSARALELDPDGSLAVTLLIARGAPLGERTVRLTLANEAGQDVTAEATFFVVRPRGP